MKKLFFAALLSMLFLNVNAQQVNITSLAINGYDPVAYFTKGQAIEGTNKISAEHDGTTYYFSSVEHQSLFERNPEQYVPQYGGYCATGVATANAKFPVDPETFKVTEGKLYLFYNGPYQGNHFNGREPWVKDEIKLIKTANSNWRSLKSK